ncbi:MAG TPA: flagellar basal body-associated FliL family protein, partial [Spongiibacteraceae bacterium]|nr:flagellar basal body-associated FliL family protein [Spongiibacteraceae bacterium]
MKKHHSSIICSSIIFWCVLSAVFLSWSAVATAEEEGGEKAAPTTASEYLDLKPAIITNFGGVGPIHFLKAEIALRVGKNQETGVVVQHHIPQIRHTLVMLLSRQTDETLSTMQGKEQIRQE